MKRTISYRLIIALLGLMLTSQSNLAAEEHLLVIDRSEAVGDTYRVKITGSSTEASSQVLNGQKVGSDTKSMSAEMTAVIEVLELHEDESVKRVAFTIESFEGDFNNEPVKIDTTKRLILTGLEEGYSYAYENGGAIEDAQTIELLDIFGSFIGNKDESGKDGEEISEQAMFILEAPRAVGSSWQCDADLMAKDMAAEGLVIDPKDIESQIKFIDTQEHHGVRCANLNIAVQMKKLVLPDLAAQGFTMDQSDLSVAINGLLPLDPNINGGTYNLKMDMVFSASADIPQGKIKVDVDVENALQIVHLPMK